MASIGVPGKVEVTCNQRRDAQTLDAKHIVIATARRSRPSPALPSTRRRIVSSTGALSLRRGAEAAGGDRRGHIGLELGSVWRRLGAEVTVVELLDRIAPGLDDEVARQFQRFLAKQGITFKLGTKVSAWRPTACSAR